MVRPDPKITELLENAREEHVYSAYQLWAERDGEVVDLAGGTTSYWPHSASVNSATRFDIASVTKAVVTTSVGARLVQAGKLRLDDTLGDSIAVFRDRKLGKVSVRELYNHCAGLAGGWFPVFEPKKLPLVDWFTENEKRVFVGPPRGQAIYSDLGFLLLGLLFETRFGKLETLFDAEVVKPLELTEIGYGPVKPAELVPATEFCLSRRRLLQGEVFDENCAYLGGKTAHAGLFATARSVGKWARGWLDAVSGKSDWLTAEIAKSFTSPPEIVAGSTWALGWDTPSAKGSSAGELFSRCSFGHLGFTGCSVWIDPDVNGVAVFLTNRVHPSRLDERVRKLRPMVHDAIHRWWEK